jgi:hypothetical protein
MMCVATLLRLVFLLGALVCLSTAAPLTQVEANPPVWPPPVKNGTLPEKDEFYKAPPGFEKAAPGTILRSRRVPGTLSLDNNSTTVNVQSAWQLQYRTQNSVGTPQASVVTVLIPYNARPGNLHMYSWYTVRTLQLRGKKNALLTVILSSSSHLIMGKIRNRKNFTLEPVLTYIPAVIRPLLCNRETDRTTQDYKVN